MGLRTRLSDAEVAFSVQLRSSSEAGRKSRDTIHLCLSIPPKFSVANTVGFLKGKSVIRIHRDHLGQRRDFTGLHFWTKGYCVSTVGLDEQTIVQYIRNHEAEERRIEQMQLKGL